MPLDKQSMYLYKMYERLTGSFVRVQLKENSYGIILVSLLRSFVTNERFIVGEMQITQVAVMVY